MKLHYGNMWDSYEKAGRFLFTGNATVKKDGALVMGRGMALDVRDRFPGIDKRIGSKLIDGAEYNLLVGKKIGVFQVKNHWSDDSDIDLIIRSLLFLSHWAHNNSHVEIHMNYPGIGNGGLDVDIVSPWIALLPDNVNIWMFAPPAKQEPVPLADNGLPAELMEVVHNINDLLAEDDELPAHLIDLSQDLLSAD